MFVAEAWLGRMHRPEDGLARLRLIRDDAAADPLTARLAERELVETLVEEGELDEAADEATAHANRLDPHFVKQTRNLARRRTMRNADQPWLCRRGKRVPGTVMRTAEAARS